MIEEINSITQGEIVDDTFPIPKGLSKFITAEDLNNNFRRYPESQRALNETEKQQILLISQRLLKLPLIHCSWSSNLQSIEPKKNISDSKYSNTHTLDVEFGLNQYTFLNWGLGESHQYGENFYCFTPELLLDSGVIVTPVDIQVASGFKVHLNYDQLSNKDKENIKTQYFQKMLTGRNWIYVNSIKILERLEKGERTIPFSVESFGEIKYLGALSSLLDYFPNRHSFDFGGEGKMSFHQKYLYPLGFIQENFLDAIQRGDKHWRYPIPTPKDWERIKHAWDNVAEIKKP